MLILILKCMIFYKITENVNYFRVVAKYFVDSI